jgi:predicted PurR-regulated permease PerM
VTDQGAGPGPVSVPEPDAGPPSPRPPGPVAMPPWLPRAMLLAAAIVIGLAVLRWLATELQGLLLLIAVSLFLSFAIEPAVNRLEARGVPRGLGTGIVFLGLFAVGGGFVVAVGAVLVDQFANLVDEAPGYIEDIEAWAERNFDVEIETDDLLAEFQEGGSVQQLATELADDILRVGARVVSGVFGALTVTLFTFYLVADAPRLRRTICSVLRPDHQREVLRAWSIAIEKTGGYLYSRALLALISFLAHWLAFALLDVPFPLPLALWVGLLSQFVPVIGTYLAGLFPILIALVEAPVTAVWVLVVVVVYQQIENYLLSPRITAHTMEVHPAVAFGAVVAGAALFGTIGALLALPAGATLQAFLTTYLDRHEVVEDGTLDH